MVLNEDILHAVTRFADRQTLATMCLLSHATRRPATRLLYRSVHVRSLDELEALDNALAQNELLGPLVSEIFQDFPGDTPLARDDAEGRLWAQRFPHRFDGPVCRIFPRLVNLEAVSLQDLAFSLEDTKDQLATALAALPRLRSVRLAGIGSANLTRIGTHAELEHISIKDGIPILITNWILRHASTLRALRIDNSGLLFRLLTVSSRTVVFPQLHSLTLPGERFSLVAAGGTMFPGVRSLTILRPQRDLPQMWPQLQHISFTVADKDSVTPLPYVSSLRLTYTGTDAGKLKKLHQWSAHHVRALVLSCTHCGFDAHSDALRIYNRLQMFEVHLPDIDNNVAEWIRRAAGLPVVPPTWEVLTLRNAAGIDGLTEETVNRVRLRAPSLKLVRVISTDGRQRRLYGWPAPLDWRDACEMVADHLPHWRETRAPWDDVCDL